MSCNCPRCNQGTDECLYDEVKRLESTIARRDAALALALKALEDIGDQFTHPHAKLPSAWAKGLSARTALVACREAP